MAVEVLRGILTEKDERAIEVAADPHVRHLYQWSAYWKATRE